ncbi:hypothetical protein STAIW_v1c04790 [Spiroplasma taiwanense CT-1]|uniref:Uncharacterized protein n=1 Tax=Spiroplasma taiwanense CT-1 TaxID=1276220 RepID=S5LWW1_9MOLU|nr:hypothetical protein STAIW_v1c04790 [Spiroplasma taiwanense CT-1]
MYISIDESGVDNPVINNYMIIGGFFVRAFLKLDLFIKKLKRKLN